MQQKEDEYRRNRDEFTVELRRERREETFKKRRTQGKSMQNGQMEDQDIEVRKKIIVDQENRELIQNILDMHFSPHQIKQFASLLVHQDLAERLRAVIGLRIVVSDHQSFQIMQEVIDNGCVPILLSYMNQDQSRQLQLEATWILTNLACGRTTQCQSIIQKNGIKVFLHVISLKVPNVSEQAMWGISNIAADCTKFRDIILSQGGLEVILRAIEECKNVSMLGQGVWAISNILRGKPKPKYQLIKAAIPALINLVMCGLLGNGDIKQALWAISSYTQTQKSRIAQLVNTKGFVSHLLQSCLTLKQNEFIAPVLRVLGNISQGNQLQTQQLLKANCLQVFTSLLDYPKKSIVRQTCWIISNICVGTKSQLAQVISCAPLMQKIANLFIIGQSEVKKQIAYIIGNICNSAGTSQEILLFIKEYDFLSGLVDLINNQTEGKCLEGGLFALYELLKIGNRIEGKNVVYYELEGAPGFFQRLQSLQNHPSQGVYQKLANIFRGFFTTVQSTL